jgi:hypothetical protein
MRIEHRYNNKLNIRPITAINEKDETLADLHYVTIGRDEEDRPSRSKPLITFWLEAVSGATIPVKQ